MSLAVTNEKGKPAPAVLGVAVVDDALLKLDDDRTPAMPTYFLLASEINKPADLESADFYLSDETKDNVPAATALDLLLGTQGWRFAEKPAVQQTAGREDESLVRPAALGIGGPPAISDNIEQIRSNYERSLADYQADRVNTLNMLTTGSFLGGLGLVLLVAMLGLLRIVSGMHLWIPAVGATACCLIIGAILMDPGPAQLRPGRGRTVPLVPRADSEARRKSARRSVAYGSREDGNQRLESRQAAGRCCRG